MDFSAWSPSHTILVIFIAAGAIGQIAVYFHKTAQNDKKIDKQGETFFHAIERLEDRMDKRFVEVIGTMNQRLTETNKRIDEVRTEIKDVRSEMNQRLSEVHSELSKLNQNYIDHLAHHQDKQP